MRHSADTTRSPIEIIEGAATLVLLAHRLDIVNAMSKTSVTISKADAAALARCMRYAGTIIDELVLTVEALVMPKLDEHSNEIKSK
jgi:hypothetical protein